jgi:hypothetical protein
MCADRLRSAIPEAGGASQQPWEQAVSPVSIPREVEHQKGQIDFCSRGKETLIIAFKFPLLG